MQDTIFAFATPEGRSAISVLRISGPACDDVISQMLSRSPVSRQATLAKVRHPVSGEILDEAIAILFPAPASFSGEDCLELHLHGSRAVREEVISALCTLPRLRLAEPGEFTKRAFLNGKSDLVRIEGLADLLEAETEQQRRQAMRQMGGAASLKSDEWRAALLKAMALLEASIDFADEGDAPLEVFAEVQAIIDALSSELSGVLAAAHASEIVRDGFKVVIAGPPNSGKSSLLNALAKREVAIVTDVAGTTRDILEVSLDIDGYLVRLFDTAGLRESNDFVEKIGIGRAKGAIEQADLVVWLREKGLDGGHCAINPSGKPVLIVNTKLDLCEAQNTCPQSELWVSTTTGQGLDGLVRHISTSLRSIVPPGANAMFVKQRQYECLRKCSKAVSRAKRELEGRQPELISEELRSACAALEMLVGRIGTEDVLGEIFSRFCMGK